MKQKSHEKNMILEEQWRRNEENMRRKQLKAGGTPASTSTNGDLSPSPSTGAMDSLLEKLRAAAPQSRDTRERRRRARLKDKHQIRVASGQQIPETGENTDEPQTSPDELLKPSKTNDSEPAPATEGGVSEGEDIADRAASLLQGLRGDAEPADPQDNTLRVRRRRESADDERSRRRARRRNVAGSADQGDGRASTTIAEETDEANGSAQAPIIIEIDEDSEEKRLSDDSPLPTPTTIVVPPSPDLDEATLKD